MLCRAPRSSMGGPLVSLSVLSLSLGWWPQSWSTEEEATGCDSGVGSLPARLLLADGAHLPASVQPCLIFAGSLLLAAPTRQPGPGWEPMGAPGSPAPLPPHPLRSTPGLGATTGCPALWIRTDPAPTHPWGSQALHGVLVSLLSTGR